IRGIGRACQRAVAAGATRLVASSGGNAGLAVAFAGRLLGVPVEVLVPSTTPEFMRERIRGEGAEVFEHGASWDDAHQRALARTAELRCANYIHPFDDPELWDGHATLVEEVAREGVRPGVVVVAVGGGGLLSGVLLGMHAVGWQNVPVVAAETVGADSYAQSLAAGARVTLPAITSRATSLGARTVCREALSWAARHRIIPCVVQDAAALAAMAAFGDHHRVLVEPACGAALASIGEAARHADDGPVLVVVCGGAAVRWPVPTPA
ncbi:MAG: pyridoxal-phosphate dependent enzyme, partial [Planctomycetes bacterium]|nr:pyridoxal-phosphate dependent enzyme [Planctomycetota bacterium]